MERKYMAKSVALNPILNNPYIEPASYYATNESGELDYERIAPGRRPFIPDIPPVPVGQGAQKSLIDVEAVSGQYEKHLINRVRVEVGQWRSMLSPFVKTNLKDFLGGFAHPVVSMRQSVMSVA
jgi:hypothetical protein